MCFVYAVTHTTVANALVIMSISPVLGALMSRVVLGEPVGGKNLAGCDRDSPRVDHHLSEQSQ